MSNCKNHIVPEYLSDLEKVATDLADMPYDKLSEFFGHLEKKVMKDSVKDGEDGRRRLSLLLSRTSHQIKMIKEQFDRIWELCKPYMK